MRLRGFWERTLQAFTYIKANPRKLLPLIVGTFAIYFLLTLVSYLAFVVFAAPRVVGSYPTSGDKELPLDSTISIVFSRNMDKTSVEKNLLIEPDLAYTLSWENNILTIDPTEDFSRDQQIKITVGAGARGNNWRSLQESFVLSFSTLSNLHVAMASPEGSITEQVKNIVVMFNKSVIKPEVDLLTIEPDVIGERKWVGTNAFVIKPENLEIGQKYKVTISQDLTSVDGGSLAMGYNFEFVNYAPAVLSMSTDLDFYGYTNLDTNPKGPVLVFANQRLNQQSFYEKFRLYDPVTREEVSYNARFIDRSAKDDKLYYYQDWEELWKQKIEVYPTTVLAAGTTYMAEIAPGFLSESGNAVAEFGSSMSFATATLPGFINSNIPYGSVDVGEDTRLELNFNSPMNVDTLKNYLVVKRNGQVVSDDLFLSAYPPSKNVNVNKFLERSSTFEVYLPANTPDKFGRPLGKPVNLIFETAPYEPSVSIYPSYTYFATFASNIDTRIITRAVNAQSLTYSLYSMDVDKFINLYKLDRTQWQTLRESDLVQKGLTKIGQWNNEVGLEQNVFTDVIYNFNNEANLDLKPGLYFLDVSIPNTDAHDNLAFVVGDTSVTTKSSSSELLVWATSLSDVSVKKDKRVTVYRLPYSYNYGNTVQPQSENKDLIVLEGRTNNDGVFMSDIQLPRDSVYLTIVDGADDIGVTFSDWNSGISSYEFENVTYDYTTSVFGPADYKGFILTDRTLYRPGQQVNFNAFLRNNELYKYSPVQGTEKVSISVLDNTYNYQDPSVIFTQDFSASDSQYSGNFVMSEGLNLGRYTVSLAIGGVQVAETQFDVQEYVRPDFEVVATVPQKPVVRGASIELSASAHYFYGAPLVSSPADYRLFKRNFIFSPDNYSDYTFYSQRRYFGDDYIWRGFEEESVLEGSTVTDQFGEVSIAPSTTTQDGISEIYTFETDVEGESGRKFTGSNEYVVHMAEYYVGLRANSYLGKAGDESSFDVMTVNPDESVAKDISVNLNVYLRKYFRTKLKDNSEGYLYEVTYEDTLVHSDSLKTDSRGKGIFNFEPDSGGTYILEVESFDSKGNRAVSDLYFYVSSDESGYWRKENHDRVDLVSDKNEYSVGDKADLVAISTFEKAIGLLTVEAEGIVDYKVFEQSASGMSQELEIKETYMPNVYVSLMLVKPGESNLKPAEFNMGIKNIQVDTSDNLLDITVSTPKTTYAPKEAGSATIIVRDSQNNPVRDAKITVALVDDSLMSIASLQRDNVFERFYSERFQAIATSQSLTQSIDRINLNTEIGAKGGSGSKGGAGGEYIDLTRSNFAETALWVVDVVTDSDGVAQAPFTLPDSITRWNLFALAQDASGSKFGQTVYKFGSVREVFGQSAVPRFMRVGDIAELGVVVHNNTATTKTFGVGIESKGLIIRDDYFKNITVEANSSSLVRFKIEAGAELPEGATLSFTIQEGSVTKDVLEAKIPVLPFGLEKIQSISNSMDFSALEEVNLADQSSKEHTKLEIEVYNSLLGLADNNLNDLLYLEYFTTDYVTSKTLPLIYRLRFAGFTNDQTLYAETKQMILNDISLLASIQKSDGGWGYWHDAQSTVHATARVLEVLAEAKVSNVVASQDVFDRGVAYVQNSLNSGSIDLDSMSYILYVMELSGVDQTGRIQTTYERRASLSDLSKAHLLMAMDANKGNWSTYIAQLKTELVQKADLGSRRIFWSTPVGLWYSEGDLGTTATVLRAFNRIDPANPVADLAIRHLTNQKNSDVYVSYNDRLKTTALIENILERNIKLRDTSIEVLVNDKQVATQDFSKNGLGESLKTVLPGSELLQGKNTIAIKSTKGGNHYYNVVLTQLLPFDVVSEESNNIGLSREVFDTKGKLITDNIFRVGESYVVRLTIATPNSRRNLLLEDFLPGGFESVNETLKNESSLTVGAARQAEEGSQSIYYVDSQQMKDSKTELQMSYLPKGFYEYSYVVRAIIPGEYKYRPAQIFEQNSPDIRANTAGSYIKIVE